MGHMLNPIYDTVKANDTVPRSRKALRWSLIGIRVLYDLSRKPNMNKEVCRQGCNIRRTKFQNLNVYCLVLQLSLRILLKPGVKSRMQM